MVSLAANGSESLKPACAEPNRALISVVRNDPKACDTSSGMVIISIPVSGCACWRQQCYPNIWGSDRDCEVVGWAKPTDRANARPVTGSACPPFRMTLLIDGGHGASAPLPTLQSSTHHTGAPDFTSL